MSNKEWVDDIENKTKFLGSGKINIRQRMWHIDNAYYIVPSCKICKLKSVKWNIKNQKYSTYCSSKCAHADFDVLKRQEDTCLLKYGFTSNLKDPKNKEKQKNTCLEKYGVDNFSKSDSFSLKYKTTCIERYGVDNVSKLASIQQKIDDTHLNRYNRKRRSQIHIGEDIINIKNDVELMKTWFFEFKMPVTEIASILNVNHSQLCSHFKNNLGIDISRHSVSSVERQVGDFLDSINVDYLNSDRLTIKPKELDLLISEFNIAIEIDGLAWHSEKRGKDKLYHKNKTNLCREKGIRLVHIFDSEWNNKQEIVKSRLSGLFEKNNKIGARKCKVVQVDFETASTFFDSNHIQGCCVQSLAYGLEYNNELVAVMSFGKSRFNKNYQWELLRYSNKLYNNVIGGAGKLFSYFLNQHNPSSVISYCDLRWNTGKVYSKIGFTEESTSLPNYWYTKNYKTIESRMRYQKHKLPAILSNFDSKLTEWENMANHGYDRIWDCGNLIFTWKR